jgi:protein-tyrosine-phosphatase
VTAPTPHVLFVCTANIVRSPIAATILHSRLRELRVDAVVESAGLREAEPVIDEAALLALEAQGVDLRAHRSRYLKPEMVRPATLILGLDREHVREAVLMEPSVWPRAFTLKEVVRRGEESGVRKPGESIEEWIAHAHVDRLPYGGTPGDYEDAAQEIDDLLARLVRLMWPQEAS